MFGSLLFSSAIGLNSALRRMLLGFANNDEGTILGTLRKNDNIN